MQLKNLNQVPNLRLSMNKIFIIFLKKFKKFIKVFFIYLKIFFNVNY